MGNSGGGTGISRVAEFPCWAAATQLWRDRQELREIGLDEMPPRLRDELRRGDGHDHLAGAGEAAGPSHGLSVASAGAQPCGDQAEPGQQTELDGEAHQQQHQHQRDQHERDDNDTEHRDDRQHRPARQGGEGAP